MNLSNVMRLALALIVLPLAGCLSSLTSEVSPIQVVSPNVRIQPDPGWPELDLALNVRRPQANQMLDGFALLVRQGRHQLLTYPQLAWADTTADLLQAELIKGLFDSGKLTGGVGRPGEIRAHGTLVSNIRHFEMVDDGPGNRYVHLEVSAMLTRNRDARQVASADFRVTRPVGSSEVSTMLDAYEAALTELVQQMVGWTLSEAQARKEILEAAGTS